MSAEDLEARLSVSMSPLERRRSHSFRSSTRHEFLTSGDEYPRQRRASHSAIISRSHSVKGSSDHWYKKGQTALLSFLPIPLPPPTLFCPALLPSPQITSFYRPFRSPPFPPLPLPPFNFNSPHLTSHNPTQLTISYLVLTYFILPYLASPYLTLPNLT